MLHCTNPHWRLPLLEMQHRPRSWRKRSTKNTRRRVDVPKSFRLAIASLRVVLSSAVEDGLITMNPAFRLGRFMESQKREHEAQAMEPGEVERFLADPKQNCPVGYYVLFLIALRAGLRQGEVLGLRWGDFQFGESPSDSNR